MTCIALASVTAAQSPKEGKKLVLNQDFSKTSTIDPAVWKFDDGPVYNNEIEKYASGPGEYAHVEDGALVITAKKEGNQVMSARLQSLGAWKNAYFEADVKVPVGKGTWPAFWMLNDRLRQPGDTTGWPKAGEVDVMENVGYDPANFHFSLHCDKYNWTKNTERTFIAPGNPVEYHKFGCDLRNDRVDFYMDGKKVKTFENKEDTFEAWPFKEKYFIILNLAIGGSWGGSKGVDDSIYPSKYYVKYVKVWE